MHAYLKRNLFLVLFALMIIPVHAQRKGYSMGYIIDLKGDTITGWIKDRSPEPFVDLCSRVRFKPENALFKRRYSPDDILEYGYDNQIFESVPLKEETSFFRFRYYVHESYDREFLKVILRNEHLTYYHREYVHEDNNYLDYIPLFHRNNSDEMVRVTQGILGLKRNRLKEYFQNCPELVEAIEKKEMDEILEVYYFYMNQCVDP